MIAKAKAVAHGIRAMLYVSGESRNKKHPERITRICDNFIQECSCRRVLQRSGS